MLQLPLVMSCSGLAWVVEIAVLGAPPPSPIEGLDLSKQANGKQCKPKERDYAYYVASRDDGDMTLYQDVVLGPCRLLQAQSLSVLLQTALVLLALEKKGQLEISILFSTFGNILS